MRKIIVITMLTLDGVMQAPGGPEEDPSEGFEYGGWTAPYGDEIFGKNIGNEMQPSDLLLGRKTFDIFAGYWPQREETWKGVNDVTKYVVTETLKQTDMAVTKWQNSTVIENIEGVRELKSQSGSDLQVWGSSDLIQSLFEHDLVDELHLKIFPLTLGKGKKLYGNGTIPAAFTLTESIVTTTGVILANYKRAGTVETGTVG
jgi:dihydrofolate reductase